MQAVVGVTVADKQAALSVTLDYVHTREQFGQRIGEFQVRKGMAPGVGYS